MTETGSQSVGFEEEVSSYKLWTHEHVSYYPGCGIMECLTRDELRLNYKSVAPSYMHR